MDFDYLFKVLLVGQPGVGKTSIVDRYAKGLFPENHLSTIGVDYRVKTVQISNGKLVKLQLWDTAGQERFRSVTTQYFRGSNAVIFVFALNDAESFAKLPFWIDTVKEHSVQYFILVGNKADLTQELEVSPEMINALCKAHENMKYLQVSAKSGQSIDETFLELAEELAMRTNLKNEKDLMKPQVVELNEKTEGNNTNKCCGTNG